MNTHPAMNILAAMPLFLQRNGWWLLPAAIVVAGLFIYGFKDLIRLSLGRVWAISSVCFRDAIRRKVLWITPLAMLGIFVVSQLQKPVDEYDAIRLTTKLCFFTTGIVVTVIAIITACTNLPREIESRVVYTIVTKPVTRLEIILGKLLGFSRVTGAILLIMGLFSFGYLEARSWWLGRQISQTLQSPSLDLSTRNWLGHYEETGLLVSQSVNYPQSMMQYARMPSGGDRWIQGGNQDALVIFAPTQDQLANVAGMGFVFRVKYEPVDSKHPPKDPPTLSLQILDARNGTMIISPDQLLAGKSVTLSDPSGQTPVIAQVPTDRANQLLNLHLPNSEQVAFQLQVSCPSTDYLLSMKADSVMLGVVDQNGKTTEIKPQTVPILRGSSGRSGQQLQGPDRGIQPLALFQFRDTHIGSAVNGQVPFELKATIDHGGSDAESGVPTEVEVRVYDRPRDKDKQPRLSPPVKVYPETRKTMFFTLPAEYCSNGDFDLLVQNLTPGHTVSLTGDTISLVSERGSFALNLFKGLFVLWLFTILTAAVALCASTFLSWPIAVVLTVLIILGNWMVSNLDLGTGLGAQIANEFFQNDSKIATTVNQSVESLSKLLQFVAGFLPDITPFGVTEQIERGVTISPAQFVAPVIVLALFGLPLITAAYVFLRNKEVAP